jgi:hypothetical protein
MQPASHDSLAVAEGAKMTIFELVKIALDQLYADARKAHGKKTDDKIKESLAYLSKSYSDLDASDRKPINYKDPAIRFAYVYKYVAAHGDYIVQVLRILRDNLSGKVFASSTARVSCIGGGPGSDIIAILKFLNEMQHLETVKKVICYLLDKEQAWADTWTELDEALSSAVALNANFQPLNVVKPETWQAQKKFLQADLFTMSYFVSEVKSLDEKGVVSDFWLKVFQEAKDGAYFLYIDNGHKKFNTYFDTLWKKSTLKLLASKDNTRLTPRYSEQASELKEYSDKFDQNPKVQAWLSYRILRK